VLKIIEVTNKDRLDCRSYVTRHHESEAARQRWEERVELERSGELVHREPEAAAQPIQKPKDVQKRIETPRVPYHQEEETIDAVQRLIECIRSGERFVPSEEIAVAWYLHLTEEESHFLRAASKRSLRIEALVAPYEEARESFESRLASVERERLDRRVCPGRRSHHPDEDKRRRWRREKRSAVV